MAGADRWLPGPDGADVRVELTNLDKVLYPRTGTTKGDVIAYYIAVAPVMVSHIAGRPVTRKRWPNGVDQPSFFEKNLVAHAPAWLQRHTLAHSSRPVTYPVIDSVAGLAWIGQQAALEVHVPQWRFDGDAMGPITRLVFDLDPGEGAGLAECARIAVMIRDVVAEVGLPAYPVTSGSKGIHVYVPPARELGSGGASAVARQVGTNLATMYPDLVTSTMAKSARAGKVFLDWSQNNPAKTTIAPYSMRGRSDPTVAAPRAWAELEDPSDLRQLRFDEVLARVAADGDLLADLDAAAPSVPGNSGRTTDHSARPRQEHDALAAYRSKRDPAKTPEPVPALPPTTGGDDKFVIQEHHARRLHWDLRLERGGVLVSWAVPKGIPTSSAGNHLAVHTEDHPLEYLTFHGSIPKGEYGGGEMTIWDSGSYETEKWRDDEVIVTLRGSRVDGRFALIRTDGTNWLLHKTQRQPEAAIPRAGNAPFPHGLSPMLATPADVSGLDAEQWAFEVKLDGFRLIVELDAGELTLRSRSGSVVTERYPGLSRIAHDLSGHSVVLDGEAVVFDDAGVANFGLLQLDSRAAEFVAFDILHLDGISLLDKRYDDRRVVLEALARLSPAVVAAARLEGSGEAALDYSREHGLEGVVAKRRDSSYHPGKRVRTWIKQKNWRTQRVVVGGWRPGRGGRAGGVGSLLVGLRQGDELRYVGRVGTGFTTVLLVELSDRVRALGCPASPFTDEVPNAEARDAVWIEPVLRAEVRYLDWTEQGRLRHPVFVRLVDETP